MSVSKYAYSYARVRARMSGLLDERRLRELVDARGEDFLALLMNTTYKEKLTNAGVAAGVSGGVDARRIERALKEELVGQYLMVIKSIEGARAARGVFEELLRRLEVKNLKAVLRAKAAAEVVGTGTGEGTGTGTGEETGTGTGAEEGVEGAMFFPVEDFFGRRISRLFEADSVESVVKELEEPYRRVLEAALPASVLQGEAKGEGSGRRVLALENALDAEISGSVWEKTGRLNAKEKGIVRRIVGTEFDIVNLMILLRCKSEGVEEREMRRYFLPYWYAFDFGADAMRDSVSAESVSASVQAMPAGSAGSAYKEVLSGALAAYEAEKTLFPFENALWKHFFATVKNTLRGYPINIGTAIGFLYLKEAEVRNLCTIAVCKENELPAEETMKILLT